MKKIFNMLSDSFKLTMMKEHVTLENKIRQIKVKELV